MRDTEKKKGTNRILIGVALFSLTIFIYKDFGIPMIIGIGALGLFVILSVVAHGSKVQLNERSYAFVLLMLFQIVQIVRTVLTGNTDQISYIPGLLLLILCLLFSYAKTEDLHKINRIWFAMSILLSGYIIIVTFVPSFYYSIVRHIISSTSKESVDLLLSKGYGVAVGGNIIIAEYIIAFTLLYMLNSFILGRSSREREKTIRNENLQSIIWIVVLLAAMVFLNRRSELISVILASGFLFVSKINFVTKGQRQKKLRALFAVIIFAVIGVSVLYATGNLGRYGTLIGMLFNGQAPQGDVSSGRFALWEVAWRLFLANPLIGIGWGNYRFYVPESTLMYSEINNVHNCYLQLLCETGIIGFVIFVAALLYIFISLLRSERYLAKDNDNIQYRIIYSTCIGYQLFFIIEACIDPVYYSLMFWFFYSTATIMACEILRIARNQTVNEKGIINK